MKVKNKYISQEDILKAKTLGYLPESVVTKSAKKILKDVKNLCDERYGEYFDGLAWCKDLVRVLIEKNDKSLKFIVGRWYPHNTDYAAIYLPPEGDEDPFPYPLCQEDWSDWRLNPERWDGGTYELCNTLNQVILDFYGIEKHEPRKLTKSEAKAKIKEIDLKVKELEGKIGRLKKKREWLASGEGIKK